MSSKRCSRKRRRQKQEMRQKCVRNASNMRQNGSYLNEEKRNIPKCVRNTPKMRQKCAKNAPKWVLFYWGKRGTFQNAPKMRQKFTTMGLILLGEKRNIPKCVRNAPKMRQKCIKHLWGRTPLDDTEKCHQDIQSLVLDRHIANKYHCPHKHYLPKKNSGRINSGRDYSMITD